MQTTPLCRQCGCDIALARTGRKRLYCSRYCCWRARRERLKATRREWRGRDEALADLAGGAVGALEALCRAVSEGHCSAEVREAAAHARREVGGLVARAEGLMPGCAGGKGARAS